MTKSLRQSTLQTLGLGSVTDVFRNGRLPVDAGDLAQGPNDDYDNDGFTNQQERLAGTDPTSDISHPDEPEEEEDSPLSSRRSSRGKQPFPRGSP